MRWEMMAAGFDRMVSVFGFLIAIGKRGVSARRKVMDGQRCFKDREAWNEGDSIAYWRRRYLARSHWN